MKNIFFLFLYFIQKVLSDYETIELPYKNNFYFISLNISNVSSPNEYPLSTRVPKSFFPSTGCQKCKNAVIDYSLPNFQNSTKNISIPYFYYNFIGKEYSTNINTKQYHSPQSFCSVENLTYANEYSGNGLFTLSFLNYNFDTEKKIFAIKFNEDNAELHLGGYDTKYDINKSSEFNVTVEHKYENYTEQIEIKNSSLMNSYNILDENNFLSEENDNNDTKYENITIELDKSEWYMNFPKLKIKTDQEKEVNYSGPYKLTLDIYTNVISIPREFFIKNIEKIFPKEGKCQVTRNGYFSCQCDEEYKTKFGSFVFENEKGTKFYINATDYMTFQSSITGSTCEVHLRINYDNDLFIGGITVLNNYYSIFDVENNMLKILPKEDLTSQETSKFLIIFFVVIAATIIILFGGYYFYNKFIINEPTGLARPNNQNANQNDNQNEEQNEDQLDNAEQQENQ